MTERPDEPSFPLKEHLGFAIQRGQGSATATLTLGPQHLNPNDVAHGAPCDVLIVKTA